MDHLAGAQAVSEELSQGEAAYRDLMRAIRRGRYRPGDRLRETEVAASLSLSRTPVREALRRLEGDGIVEHRARIGAVIRTLSQSEVVELYEMRAVLERTAAQLAAKHAGEAEMDAFEEINGTIRAARDDAATAAHANQDFHRCIHRSTRNRFLLDAARALNNALILLGPTTMDDAQRIDIVCREHAEIIAAIRDGDAGRAGDAAQSHLETSLRHRLRVLRS